jgi:hypothetical protein
MPTRNGGSNSNSLRTDLSSPVRSDKAAFRLAIKENDLKTYGRKLNSMTEEQLQTSIGDRIANNLGKAVGEDGKQLNIESIIKRLLPEAAKDHEAKADAYAKKYGESAMAAYDIVSGNSRSETGYMQIGNYRFSFQYRVESSTSTEYGNGDRNDRTFDDESVRVDYKTIKQA